MSLRYGATDLCRSRLVCQVQSVVGAATVSEQMCVAGRGEHREQSDWPAAGRDAAAPDQPQHRRPVQKQLRTASQWTAGTVQKPHCEYATFSQSLFRWKSFSSDY